MFDIPRITKGEIIWGLALVALFLMMLGSALTLFVQVIVK